MLNLAEAAADWTVAALAPTQAVTLTPPLAHCVFQTQADPVQSFFHWVCAAESTGNLHYLTT
jgi:hypothetical protein